MNQSALALRSSELPPKDGFRAARQLDLRVHAVHRADPDFAVRFDGEAESRRGKTYTADVVLHVLVADRIEDGADVLVKVGDLLREWQAQRHTQQELFVDAKREPGGELTDEEGHIEVLWLWAGAAWRGRRSIFGTCPDRIAVHAPHVAERGAVTGFDVDAAGENHAGSDSSCDEAGGNRTKTDARVDRRVGARDRRALVGEQGREVEGEAELLDTVEVGRVEHERSRSVEVGDPGEAHPDASAVVGGWFGIGAGERRSQHARHEACHQ